MTDILEDLCSADPEETPSAAKLVMTHAAAEIETLRTQNTAMSAENERLRAALSMVVKAWDNPGLIDNAVEAARAALKESK
jgi:hypothetical protein